MSPLTETCATYKPGHITDERGNPLPDPVKLVASQIACNIHRGVKAARDAANALGVYGPQVAYLYAKHTDYEKFGDRYIVVDERGWCWVVVNRPALHTRFKGTRHMRCLLNLMTDTPDGVPE